MKTYVANMQDPKTVHRVEEAYYNLFTPMLQCIEQKQIPEHAHMTDPRVKMIVAEDNTGKIVGVLMVDGDGVYFPVMKEDYVNTLRVLIARALAVNGGYLEAETDNQLILESAMAMNMGVKRDGNRIWYGAKKK